MDGATGEIAPCETWVELWILRDAQAEEAMARVKDILEQSQRDDWLFDQCLEPNPETFEVYWQCGEER